MVEELVSQYHFGGGGEGGSDGAGGEGRGPDGKPKTRKQVRVGRIAAGGLLTGADAQRGEPEARTVPCTGFCTASYVRPQALLPHLRGSCHATRP